MTGVTRQSSSSISALAFLTLMLVALLMGSNHVAARIAFNHGLDVSTAVVVRSAFTAIMVSGLIFVQKIPFRVEPRQWRILAVIGILISIQSWTLYSAVAALPVSLALLTFNSYPLWAAFWARVIYKHQSERQVLMLMPLLLLGLALALDVTGSASGLGAKAQWDLIGWGVLCAVVGAATFGLVLVLIEFETKGLDGRLRTSLTMWMVSMITLGATQYVGDFHWPMDDTGWWGLLFLCLFYSSGITLMFTVLPRLGVVGNSAILNLEPIFALMMAWAILGQSILMSQLAGALLVVGVVIKLGTRKRSS
jgi:drug/metabolite transporter (DMT)-like permease